MTRSESIGKLALALSKAQAKIEGASKDAKNPHFNSRYADLASIVDACRGPLAENELGVLQSPSADGNLVRMTTLVVHSSGEWIESDPLQVQAKDAGPQSVGSCLTYLRRYQLAGMVGIAPVDDDAEAAEGRRHGTDYRSLQVVPAKMPAEATHSPTHSPTSFDPQENRQPVRYGVDSGHLTIISVRVNPTKNSNVKKAVVLLSDGRQVQTIKDKLIALCEQLQQEGAPVDVQTKTSDKWGEELTGVTRALPEIQINDDMASDHGQPITADEIPF